MKCVEVYKELYHQEPFDVAFCPYRISPLGAHIDHQYGKINGLAIDKGIHMAYHPKQNGVVELQSLNFPKRAQFFVSAVPEEKQGDWADHLRGAAKMLGEKYRLKVGLSGIIEGSLPIGGLSSSASVIICFLSALCKVNGIHLKPMEMILTAKAAENQYVGDGTNFEALKDEFSKNTNILFRGKVSNVNEYLHASDVYLATSKSEGLPNGVLEAMACGLPVLLSDIPQHMEVLEADPQCGHSYKLGNAKQLLALMDQMMDENLFEMGERSYTAVMENFTAEGMSKRYQNLYLKLMNKGGR